MVNADPMRKLDNMYRTWGLPKVNFLVSLKYDTHGCFGVILSRTWGEGYSVGV